MKTLFYTKYLFTPFSSYGYHDNLLKYIQQNIIYLIDGNIHLDTVLKMRIL